MTLLLFCLGLWLGYLALEVVRLTRWQEKIPIRIAVTGTRGKSSVVRLLADTLREDGWEVLAKTTGSGAVMILPNGEERPISRRGRPSILEQIGVVGMAARLGVDAVLAEVMSVHTENRMVECRRILKPHLVLVTNFRVDHVDAQGESRAEVAQRLALDVPPGARVLVPESQLEEGFELLVKDEGGLLETVQDKDEGWPGGLEIPAPFRPNVALVRAAANVLGVAEEVLDRVVEDYARSFEQWKVWDYLDRSDGSVVGVVNAFAANDPESTCLVLDEVLGAEVGPMGAGEDPIGLLSLRGDRGDRSLLWAEALSGGVLDRFSMLFIHGLHAHALERRLKREGGPPVRVLRQKDPAEIMKRVLKETGAGSGENRTRSGFLFGFGNMGGLGERLVRHWEAVGRPKPMGTVHRSPGGTRGD